MNANLVKQYVVLVLAIMISTSALGQEKLEREFRIKEKDVPQKALDFINALSFSKKIKWYKEIGLTSTTVEAKTKSNRKKYSIEFDSLGQIEDIEINIKWKELPTDTQNKITAYLSTAHQKHKIRKIQIQYTGDEALLIDAVKKTPSDAVVINYEIVLKAKTNNEYKLLEYLFSNEGIMRSKATIILNNSDNLEF